ncbi:TPM domain-containing protein [Aquabacterium sp.]|uniref:TPM domain-containing protein n=1 Tax=Aquabacterium sp. TaxID=1872578 RepID=UPI0019BF4863|nr:TPM domain-containing protein [Aquabacterium sp.]MBC7701577.1 TPM domain-containing protein [Aquabacterium sp.]
MTGKSRASAHPLLRWPRHLWTDEADVRRQLGAAGLKRLQAQVRASEVQHLGELRLCIEGGLSWQDLTGGQTARSRALHLFSTLRVWDTEHNNGVLIYLLLADHRIEILADRGIMARAGHEHWAHIAQQLAASLHDGQFEQGLSQAIASVTQLLAAHFPVDPEQDNPNELPDRVVVI